MFADAVAYDEILTLEGDEPLDTTAGADGDDTDTTDGEADDADADDSNSTDSRRRAATRAA